MVGQERMLPRARESVELQGSRRKEHACDSRAVTFAQALISFATTRPVSCNFPSQTYALLHTSCARCDSESLKLCLHLDS
jgi:hypothetical protein